MKKTLFILSYSHFGGAETRAVDLAMNLRDSLIPIFIVYGKKNGDVQKRLKQHEIEVYSREKFNWHYSSRYKFYVRLVNEVFYLLKIYFKIKPFSMISFCADANIFLFFLNTIVRRKRVYWCQVDDFLQWRWKRIFLYAIRHSQNVIAVSEFITEQTDLKTGRNKSRIITIPNRINPSTLIIDKIPSSIIRISVVGHVNPNKNQGLAIQALKRILEKENIRNIELNIYGHVTDNSYWDLIKVNENWLKYRGYHDKNYIYNNSDIIIIPSKSEASSLVLQEAMYFGISILCSDIPIFKKINAPCVRLFELDNNDDLVVKLREVILASEKSKFNLGINYENKYYEYLEQYKNLLV
jgi:glycosyltransferase involved in cell wall biosynthesis